MFKGHISDFLNQNYKFDFTCDKIKVKINGDGAKMTTNSNFIFLSFSVFQAEEPVTSAKGNRTLDIVNGSESYHTIKGSFQNLFKEKDDLLPKEK